MCTPDQAYPQFFEPFFNIRMEDFETCALSEHNKESETIHKVIKFIRFKDVEEYLRYSIDRSHGYPVEYESWKEDVGIFVEYARHCQMILPWISIPEDEVMYE